MRRLDPLMARLGWVRIEKHDRLLVRITSLQSAVTSLGAEVRALSRQNALLRAGVPAGPVEPPMPPRQVPMDDDYQAGQL